MPDRAGALIGAPIRDRSGRLTARIARTALALFFRRVEVVGAENVPAEGPLLVVANHPNALIDPVVLLGILPRRVRFLGKSTLWEIPPLRPFLALAGVIPVYRPTDPGVDPSKNTETFARCREALLEGDAIAIFPEGTSHGEPYLQPLKTGAARIALGAAADLEAAGRSEPVRLLPVGLTFDERERFRSRVLMVVGRPFDAAAAAGGPGDGLDPARVRAVTAALERGLAEVTVAYRSWDEARLLARAVELFDRPEVVLPGERSLTETHRLARTLASGLEEVREAWPEETARVAGAAERYDRMLAAVDLRDDQVAARYPKLAVARWTAKTVAAVLLGLPPALLGALLNALPYRLVGRLASRPAMAPELQATWKLFGALFLYPVAWGLEAGAAAWLADRAGWERPWLAAVAVLAAAPLTGWAALFVWERGSRLVKETRAYLLLRSQPDRLQRLREARDAVRQQVGALAERYAARRPA